PAFKQTDKIFAGNTGHAQRAVKENTELLLEHTVHPLEFLFFPELYSVVRALSSSRLGILPGHCPFAVDRTLVRLAPVSLEKQFLLLRPAKPAKGSCISSHFSLLCQIRRVLRGRQPLWGIGVTSLMDRTFKPSAPRERT